MKHLLLILLALGLSATACSKKKSSSPPPATVTDDDDDGSYGSKDWSGPVTITNQNTYQYFLLTAFGHMYNNQFNYSMSCNLDLMRGIYGILTNGDYRSFVGCNSTGNLLGNLSNGSALVELRFTSSNRVEGLWVVSPNNYGYEIPFQGNLTQYSDGRFLIEAGPLAFLTTVNSNGSINEDNFNVYYIWYNNNGVRATSRFANVTIRQR